MLNPENITQTSQAGQDRQQAVGEQLSGSLDTSVTADGAANASAIMASVGNVISGMQQQMQQTLASIQADIKKHQLQQAGEKSWDFNLPMPDLRPTAAKGFPEEQGAAFFAELKTPQK